MSQFETAYSGFAAATIHGSTTTGVDEIDRRLQALEYRAVRRVVRASLNAGLTVLNKAIREELDAVDISPELRRALKRTIGRRVKRARGAAGSAGMIEAKAGFGVGAARRRAAVRSGKSRSGVGIGGPNAHWFALGTAARQKKTGHAAGRIRQLRIVDNARRKSSEIVAGAMRKKAFERIEAEVAKLAAK